MITKEQHVRIRQLFFGEHWTIGTIASQLGLHRDVVVRVVGCDTFNKTGSARPSALDPFVPFIQQTLERFPTLTGTRIHQMVKDRGYDGSVVQVRRRIKKEGWRKANEAFFERNTLPGEEGQVDWVDLGDIPLGAAERRLYGLVVALSCSRGFHMYPSFDMKSNSVLSGHVEAFEHFKGVPRRLLYDGMKTAVLERQGSVVRFHPRLLELCAHYAIEPVACAPRRPTDKGKVERRIRDIRTSFMAGRRFVDIDDVREQFAQWRFEVAYGRRHPDDATQTVAESFEDEKSRLLPLPLHPMSTDLVVAAVVGKQPYVHFETNRYSVPHTLVGKTLSLVVSQGEVRIFEGQELVAQHARSFERRKRIEEPAHLRALAKDKRHARSLRGRSLLLQLVPQAEALYGALLERHIPMGPQTIRLLVLLDQYGAEPLRVAIVEALERGTVGAESIERLLCKAQASKPSASGPLNLPSRPGVDDLHVTNHRLEDYDDLICE